MIRFALALTLLAAPAFADTAAWVDQIAAKDAATHITGAINACTTAVTDPGAVATGLTTLGWQHFDETEGTTGLKSANTYLMFWNEPGFCMLQTSDFNTETLTAHLATLGIKPSGKDADGCVKFTINGIPAAISSGGNDPACTSTTEAVLRFEPLP